MTILIVDDDPLNTKLTAFLLESSGYQTVKVHDGLSALKAVVQYNPDLILLDVCMPNISGFDVCRQIRCTSDVPIIFLSGVNQLQERVMALQIGGDDYICKPFEPQELLARVNAVLRRRDADVLSTFARIAQGDLTLEPIEHKVLFHDGKKVILTPIEFRLLYYLMKNTGRVLNADQIIDKVWGYNDASSSNLVAVYIRRLRAKIEHNPRIPLRIITVPNLGYKFTAIQEQAVVA